MEQLSVFDIFKIGVGPSSSHTMGPWRAAQACLKVYQDAGTFNNIKHIKINLYGSLAKTGKGHGTDIAVLLGLSGEDPVTIDVNAITPKMEHIRQSKKLNLGGVREIDFNAETDLIFLFNESLPYHPNALTFFTTFNDGTTDKQTFYSVGGGFVEKEGEQKGGKGTVKLPFPIATADDLRKWCGQEQKSISAIVMENEKAWRETDATIAGALQLWDAMRECVYRGAHTNGMLPGGLKVIRRANDMNKKQIADAKYSNSAEWIAAIKQQERGFQQTLNWVSCFALAVNEENASFGRVVTAPTNGAAGVIPAVLMYYICFGGAKNDADIVRFIATAAEIGCLFKKGATISAAMGGCQAEIGVSSAMAAAALTECIGGTADQAMMAAEIAMEHHLGLTCDPIGGLVQIPCIERNTMGAIKAITASQLAMTGNPHTAKVSLDAVIRTMWETALDMNSKYKETSDGGLATNIPVNLPEC